MIMKPPACCIFLVNNAMYKNITIRQVSAIFYLEEIIIHTYIAFIGSVGEVVSMHR